MIILHKDHTIYEPPEGWCVPNRYLWKTISGFYYLKFQEIFEENNLDYKLTSWEDYPNVDGEYFIGRFAHAKEDKELHQKYYFDLKRRFDNIWPDELAYELYDNKPEQMKYLDSKGYQKYTDYQVVNSIEELCDIVEVGNIIKSHTGASSDNVFFITEKKYCERNELISLISECYSNTLDEYFPAIIQPFFEGPMYKISLTNSSIWAKVYNYKHDFSNPLNFGYGHPKQNWVERSTTAGHISGNNYMVPEDELKNLPNLFIYLDIKKEIGTPNLTFDVIGDKILEFTYLFNPTIPLVDTYGSYNIDTSEFETIKDNERYIAYQQHYSVLKGFNLV